MISAPLLQLGCGGEDDDTIASVIAPADACIDRQTLKKYGTTTPPGYSAVLAWANAMTGSSSHAASSPAKVEVDYIRLLEAVSPSDSMTVIASASEEYEISRAPLSAGEGALYPRIPKCSPGASDEIIALSSVDSGVLTINLASTPKQYAHWWTPRGSLLVGKSYFVESRFRVTGGAYIQFGVDYWRDPVLEYNGYDETCAISNNCEAWVSDWFADTGGQFIVRRVPVL